MKRLGYILGRRIKGDIELGQDPTSRLSGAIIAPGQRLIGQPEQGIYEQSADPHYLIGTRMVIGDRVFRYSHHSGAGLNSLFAAFTDGARVRANTGHTAAFLGATAGDLTITYHPLDAVEENELAEGILACFVPHLSIGIKSNTASAGAGAACEVTLKRPLPLDITAGQWIVCYPNIYAYLLRTGEYPQGCGTPHLHIFFSAACVPLIEVTGDHYFWGQTWGPCEMLPGLWGNLIGRTDNQREVFVCYDGGITYHPGVGATDCLLQTLGHVIMAGTTPNTPNGDQLIFLRLAP